MHAFALQKRTRAICRRGRNDSACTLRGGAAFLAKGDGDATTARQASPSGKRNPTGTRFIGRSGRGLRCGMGDPDPWPACPNGTMLFLHGKTTPPSPGNYSAARLTFSHGLSLALRNYSAAFWKLLRASLSAYTYFQRFSLAACAE